LRGKGRWPKWKQAHSLLDNGRSRQRRANLSLRETVSQYWQTFQHGLFPWLAEELGPLSERNKRLVQVLELVRVEDWLPDQCAGGRGRPQESRAALARAFLAKAVFDVPTTRALVERLSVDALFILTAKTRIILAVGFPCFSH